MKWKLFYASGDSFAQDGHVMADNEQEALWKGSILHPGRSVYVVREIV